MISRNPFAGLDGNRASRRRSGFTLVELLVVIAIIAILMALLAPAVINAISRGNDAKVTSEISALQQALAAFKNQYGDYPPSRIMLSETGVYPAGANAALTSVAWFPAPTLNSQPAQFGPTATAPDGEISLSQLAERSIGVLRKFFPRAQFSVGVPPSPTNMNFLHDFNGNGVNDGLIYLSGDECLVFFLGGISIRTERPLDPLDTPKGIRGLGRNPVNPFQPEAGGVPSGNYKDPFFDFRGERLMDPDGDKMLSYGDPYVRPNPAPQGYPYTAPPYAYFAPRGSNNYDPNDCNFVSDARAFRRTNGSVVPSPGPNPYTQSDALNTSNPPTSTSLQVRYWNPDTYQLISPGGDQIYGVGGTYDKTNESSPFPERFDPSGQTQPTRTNQESDNITNFNTGRLN